MVVSAESTTLQESLSHLGDPHDGLPARRQNETKRRMDKYFDLMISF
jgi:hypothetical protein